MEAGAKFSSSKVKLLSSSNHRVLVYGMYCTGTEIKNRKSQTLFMAVELGL